MKRKILLFILAFVFCQNLLGQQTPAIPEIDRIRIAEAFRIGEKLGNRIWKSWDKAPFAVLLVTPDYEFLIRHPQPSKDFADTGYDELLKSKVYYRKRVFNPNLLATFPAVGGISTIVIGQAENTSAKSSTPWIVTLLHEHFHQLQNSQPDYYTGVEKLDLSGGDTSGMWMLNYNFPYSKPEVKKQFSALSRLLAEALEAKSQPELKQKTREYLSARREFKQMLDPKDYRYFSFQLWQEGVARYTELKIAEQAAKNYKRSGEFRKLKDYRTFKTTADDLRERILNELRTLELDEYKRVAFYPLGAGEALLLDRLNSKWKERYFKEKFDTEGYFQVIPAESDSDEV